MRAMAIGVLLLATLGYAASAQNPQGDITQLRSGTHVRVWYDPYRLSGQPGVVTARRGDSIRVRLRDTLAANGRPLEDFQLFIPTLDFLEVGVGRSGNATVIGGITGLVAGFVVGFAISRGTGLSDQGGNKAHLSRFIRISGAAVGAAVGAVLGAGKSEHWEAVRLR
jgi:hypothetical protein